MRFLEKLIAHSGSKIPAREQVGRFFLHIPWGFIIVVASWLSAGLAAAIAILFGVYEVNEDGYLSDRAWVDVKGVLGGLVIGGGIWIGFKLFCSV